MNILLLEPNRLLARQYIAYLEGEGNRVAWHQDAQGGIAAADSLKPDLVIAELLLAGHSGIEFLYEFRSYSDWLGLPVIVLSNVRRSSLSLPEGALEELGVAAFLYKPDLSLKRLGQIIAKI
jgi:DNA-binding response OmpR family regulator